jgi:hypothetical protein
MKNLASELRPGFVAGCVSIVFEHGLFKTGPSADLYSDFHHFSDIIIITKIPKTGFKCQWIFYVNCILITAF